MTYGVHYTWGDLLMIGVLFVICALAFVGAHSLVIHYWPPAPEPDTECVAGAVRINDQGEIQYCVPATTWTAQPLPPAPAQPESTPHPPRGGH